MTLADYKINGRWAKAKRNGEGTLHTYSYIKWLSIKARCKAEKSDVKNRTYQGCTISEDFLDYQKFVDWHVSQVGYGVVGYHIDKDILKVGNKEYSSANCVLVPYQLNAFLLDSAASRGDCPRGVSFRKDVQKFRAYVMLDGKQSHLGFFSTKDEASQAYVAAKEKEAVRWISRLESGEFEIDPRVISSLKDWRVYGKI